VEEKYLFAIDRKKWDAISTVREQVLKEIEEARNQKLIGDSLEAEIELELPDDLYVPVSEDPDLFKEILVVSKVDISRAESIKISIRKSQGRKCPRCWNWIHEDPAHKIQPELCSRCDRTVKERKIES
jgi:isoleucyl-tRNA synthetase